MIGYPVIYMPGPMRCGKCYRNLREDEDPKVGATYVVVRCWNMNCEQHDVPLRAPITSLKLQKAEVACECVEVDAGGCVGFDRTNCAVHAAGH